MNLPNCVPGMQPAAGELKDLADFRAAYQQQQVARQQFASPASLLAPQQVRQFAGWPAPHAQAPFGYQPYPYQLYPSQPQLTGWPQVSQVPDLKAALQLPQPQPLPLASLSSDVSQTSREEAQLASFLQAQHTFLQRGSTSLSASLGPSASFGTSPSRRAPSSAAAATSASPSRPPASSTSYPPSDHHRQQLRPPPEPPAASSRRPAPPAPAPSTSLASHASHSTATHAHALSPPAPPTHLSDDLLMRVVRGDNAAIDTLSHHPPARTLHPAPSAASHPGSMWSKPTHAPHQSTLAPRSKTPPAPADPANSTDPSPPVSAAASRAASAALDARLAALQPSPAAVKALLGSTDYYHARMTLLGQQEVFLQQLWDLHRLVSTQKLLAAELRHPEHSPSVMHQAVSQQKVQLEQQLTRDLHLLRNIPATLRNPWLAHSTLDPPPTASKFRVSRDTPQGKSLPRPAPQHPSSSRRPPLPAPAPPAAASAPLRSPSTSLSPAPLDLAPSPPAAAAASKPPPTLIRPIPTALAPPPALYQPVDIHSMWVAKHGATASASSGKPQPSTSLAPISLPSQMTAPGLSSDCMASFGLGLSSLSGCTNSLGLQDPPSAQQRTRVRYWWQDEAGTFADVGLPDDLQLHSRTRGESGSAAVSTRDRGEPSAPPKKRAKFKEGSQAPSAQAPAEPYPPSDRAAERQQGATGGAGASPLGAAKEAGAKSRSGVSAGKPQKHARSKRTSAARAAGPHSNDSGSSECSAPTQERAHTAAESKPQPAPTDTAAAASKEDTATDHRSDAVAGQSTAHSAANILLSISSSFRPA